MKKILSKLMTVLFIVTLFNFNGYKVSAETVGESPFFEEVHVFDVSKDGYPVIRIPGIATTNDGSLLAYGEARSNGSDWATMDIVMKKSTDGGRTWSNITVLADGVAEDATYNNPVVIPEKDSDTVHLLYCREYATAYYRKSTDNGSTWSDPVEITSTFDAVKDEYNWTVIATGPGHGIQLQNGRLLVPVWLSLNKSHSPSVTSTIYSDDGGATWNLGEIIYAEGYMPNPNETAAVELTNGDVLLSIRNTSGTKKRAISVSKDGATNWSKPKMMDELDDPTCFGSVARLTSDDEYYTDRILSTNVNNVSGRNNLVVKMSKDNGETWTQTKTIRANNAAYSDIAISNDKKEIYVLYEPNDLKTLTLARFNLEWLTNGEESLDSRTEAPVKVNKKASNVTLNETWQKVSNSWNGEATLGENGLHLQNSGGQKTLTNRDVNITPIYTLEMKLKADSLFNGSLGNNANIGTKVHDGLYRLMLDIKSDGIYAITDAGAWTKVANVSIDKNWHEYKAIVNNGSVELYMDGAKVGNFKLQERKDADYIQHWTNGTTASPVSIHEEYIKITNNIQKVDLGLVNTKNMNATASSEEIIKDSNGAKNVIDGDNNSFWHTEWGINSLPAELVVDMGEVNTLSKIGFLPRQVGGTNGMITKYELYVSEDGESYTKVSEGNWSYGSEKKEQIVQFTETKGRFVKLVALQSVGNESGYASLGEMKFYRDNAEVVVAKDVEAKTTVGTAPKLPSMVQVILSTGDNVSLPVEWNEYDLSQCLTAGEFTIEGRVNGEDVTVQATVKVEKAPLLPINPALVETEIGKEPVMPGVVEVTYTDGEKGHSNVTWEAINQEDYSKAGEFIVKGKIAETNIAVYAKVVVSEVSEEIIVSKVEGLKVTEVTNNSAKITWEAPKSTAGLTEYVVYKDGKEFTTVQVATTELDIQELRTNTIYGIKVTARYSNGQESNPRSINLRTANNI